MEVLRGGGAPLLLCLRTEEGDASGEDEQAAGWPGVVGGLSPLGLACLPQRCVYFYFCFFFFVELGERRRCRVLGFRSLCDNFIRCNGLNAHVHHFLFSKILNHLNS